MLYRYVREDAGTTAIEYALIGTLILVAAVPAIIATSDAVSANLYDIIGGIAAAI